MTQINRDRQNRKSIGPSIPELKKKDIVSRKKAKLTNGKISFLWNPLFLVYQAKPPKPNKPRLDSTMPICNPITILDTPVNRDRSIPTKAAALNILFSKPISKDSELEGNSCRPY